mmetsp:Transcript_13241/g.21738  ORF Transcript_13241/g.21738 Transcript_13241/m.21738 type:complete len:249 (+) Transcript_13241:335-1081(+)
MIDTILLRTLPQPFTVSSATSSASAAVAAFSTPGTTSSVISLGEKGLNIGSREPRPTSRWSAKWLRNKVLLTDWRVRTALTGIKRRLRSKQDRAWRNVTKHVWLASTLYVMRCSHKLMAAPSSNIAPIGPPTPNVALGTLIDSLLRQPSLSEWEVVEPRRLLMKLEGGGSSMCTVEGRRPFGSIMSNPLPLPCTTDGRRPCVCIWDTDGRRLSGSIASFTCTSEGRRRGTTLVGRIDWLACCCQLMHT